MAAAVRGDMAEPNSRQTVRSYVRRSGRMTKAQRRALDEYAARYLVSPDGFSAPADEAAWAKVFARRAPLVVEIGSGYGEATAAMAAADSSRNYIAFEVHTPGVGALMNRLAQNEVTNVRIVPADATAAIAGIVADSAVSAFNIFFPDPWRKRRHHKRRLLCPAVLALLLTKLRPGGSIHFVTDWQPYAQAAERVFAAATALIACLPQPRAVTAYEQRARAAGREIYEFYFCLQSPGVIDKQAGANEAV